MCDNILFQNMDIWLGIQRTHKAISRMSVAGEDLLISILLATAEQSDRPTDRQRPIREVITSIDLCQDQHNERPPHGPWAMRVGASSEPNPWGNKNARIKHACRQG